jgi:hypothetical protein
MTGPVAGTGPDTIYVAQPNNREMALLMGGGGDGHPHRH